MSVVLPPRSEAGWVKRVTHGWVVPGGRECIRAQKSSNPQPLGVWSARESSATPKNVGTNRES